MPNESGPDTPQASPIVGLVRPARQDALDLALESVKRLSNLSLGDPETVTGETKFTAKPGRLHYVDTSQGDVHCYLSGIGGKSGQACTIINAGKEGASFPAGAVYVHPPQGATIDGWPYYPLVNLGSSAVFVNISKNRFTKVGERQTLTWPQLSVDTGDSTSIALSSVNGHDKLCALRMNDGRICTTRLAAGTFITADVATTGLGGVVGGSASVAGLYHIYAVPHNALSHKFSLVLQPDDGNDTWPVDPTTRLTVAPTGYSIYKYLGSWKAVSIDAVVQFPSLQTTTDGWFLCRNWEQYTCVSGTSFTPAAQWYEIDGSTYVTSLVTTNFYSFVPRYAAKAASLHISASLADGTSSQTFLVGQENAFDVATAGQNRVLSVAGSAEDSRFAHNSFHTPIGTDGLYIGFGSTTDVAGLGVSVRGYWNTFYGMD